MRVSRVQCVSTENHWNRFLWCRSPPHIGKFISENRMAKETEKKLRDKLDWNENARASIRAINSIRVKPFDWVIIIILVQLQRNKHTMGFNADTELAIMRTAQHRKEYIQNNFGKNRRLQLGTYKFSTINMLRVGYNLFFFFAFSPFKTSTWLKLLHAFE